MRLNGTFLKLHQAPFQVTVKKQKKNKNKTPDHFLFAFLSGRKGLLSVFPVNSQSASNIPIAF